MEYGARIIDYSQMRRDAFVPVRSQSRSSSSSRRSSDSRSQSRTKAPSRQPRAAVSSGESSQGRSLSSRIERSQHDRRKRRASKQFERNVAQTTHEEESGTRAAVHRGAMGSRQRRASRMHAEASPYKSAAQLAAGGLNGVKSGIAGVYDNLSHGGIFNTKLILVVCVLLLCVCVYGPTKNYYTATRDLAKNQVEYAALQDYRDELQSEVDTMDTDEGVEDAARSKYGWVKSNETGLVVSDATTQDDFDATDIGIVPDGTITAPETWYSWFLDPFFGYKG